MTRLKHLSRLEPTRKRAIELRERGVSAFPSLTRQLTSLPFDAVYVITRILQTNAVRIENCGLTYIVTKYFHTYNGNSQGRFGQPVGKEIQGKGHENLRPQEEVGEEGDGKYARRACQGGKGRLE